MPTGAPMPSCSSTTKSCGSTWRISRPGRQRHRLGGVDRAPHVLARDLAVLAGDRDHAAAVEALDVRARQRQVDRVDLDAGHQLGLVDRLLDRIDRRLEVDDDAAPDAARLGDAEADDVEARRRRASRRRPPSPSTCRRRVRPDTALCAPLCLRTAAVAASVRPHCRSAALSDARGATSPVAPPVRT